MAAIDAPFPALPPALPASMADDTLVRLIAAGSDDAFAALDGRYRRRLVRFARGFVPGGGLPDAEDAVQDAMVRAVRALRAGSRPDAVGPWLHRIARNCALDLTAARRRHPVAELADHVGAGGLVSEDAQAAVERRLGVRGLVADVARLPDTQRSALVLRELEGRSYADIADELDVTVPAVKSLLVRARQGLKRARDDRRVAAWLPLPPVLSRLADRAGALWEPVAATATPKLACAAVVVAGSLPALSGPTPAAPASARPPAHHAAPAPSGLRVPAAPTMAERAAAAAVGALREDCTDGTIDGRYPRATLLQAFRDAGGRGAEYGDCGQALAQALLKK